MKAKLILEDGSIYEGHAFGYIKETVGEVVFNTGMTGYQEMMTDPSYKGQIVLLTYPLIGNYGVKELFNQSKEPTINGFIVRECYKDHLGWQKGYTLENYMKENKIIGIEKIDTRVITKKIREKGTMRGMISCSQGLEEENIREKILSYDNRNAVAEVSTKRYYCLKPEMLNIAVIDYGVKAYILKSFQEKNCLVHVFPAFSTPEEILKVNPDGIVLSNGPGDPIDLEFLIPNIKKLIATKIPILGICLGHQLLSIALGGKTQKIKYGHRGSNHPVKDLDRNKVYITSQNHGYVVEPESLDKNKITITHVNMNDGTLEGFRHNILPILSVQFHPEAGPGPCDSRYIFDEFIEMIEGVKERKVKIHA